jgi:hypothetical protein
MSTRAGVGCVIVVLCQLQRSRVNSQTGTRTTDEGRCLPGLRRTEQPSTCKIGCLSPVYLRVTRSAKSRTTSTSALVIVTLSYRHKQGNLISTLQNKTKQNGEKTQLTCMVLHTRTPIFQSNPHTISVASLSYRHALHKRSVYVMTAYRGVDETV